MKKTFLFLVLSAAVSALSAQEENNRVSGKILEESTKLPLEFAFVSIMHPGDSLLSGGDITNSEGKFHIDSLSAGNYYLVISLLGFDTIITPEFILPSDAGNEPSEFYMKTSALLLGDVAITEERSTLVSTIDRKIYFPEKDLQAQTGSASDILQNIPSITVDADGNISLRGSGNVTILINGKPSQLMNASGAAALEQIPASSIERIEIITNPSAKFKPDGVAGIINIVLKKNARLGFNGAATVNASTLDRYNGNLNMNYSTGKYNIFGSYGYRQNFNQRAGINMRTFRDSVEGSPSHFLDSSLMKVRMYSHTLNIGMDYSFSKSNSMSFEGIFFTAKTYRSQYTTTSVWDTSGTTSRYSTDRRATESEYEAEGSLLFEHTFPKEDHAISFEAGWGKYGELENQHFLNSFDLPFAYTYEAQTSSRQSGNVYSVYCDYTNPVAEDMELEIGYSGELYRQQIEFTSKHFDAAQADWMEDVGRNNIFRVKQDVHAVYSTFTAGIEDLTFMGGLRAEQTFITSDLISLDSVIPNNYFMLFPTAHFLYEISDNKEIGLSYSRRVNRPDPDELNPFPDINDPRNIESGNPYLKPEQVHSLELGYQFKNQNISFLPGLYFRYTYDAFAEITSYVNDSVLLTTQANLATDQSAGIELVFAWKYKKLFNFNLSSNIYYNTIDASNLGYSENKSTIAWDAKFAGNINLSKTTKFQLNCNYRSKMLTAQGHSLPVYFVNAGLRQDVFKKRASVTITVSDVFNTMRWVEIIDTPLLQEEVSRKRKSQFIFIGFTWRFGMIAKKAANDMMFDNKM